MTDKTTRIEVTAENAAQFGIIVPEGVPFEKIFDCEPLTGDQIKEHHANVQGALDTLSLLMSEETEREHTARESLQALMVDAARSRVALLILASASGIIEEPADG